jgi:hypothetical protein
MSVVTAGRRQKISLERSNFDLNFDEQTIFHMESISPKLFSADSDEERTKPTIPARRDE